MVDFPSTYTDFAVNWFDSFKSVVDNTEDFISTLLDDGYFRAPASTMYHGCHEGGLWEHSVATTKHLLDITENMHLAWSRPESPYIVGLFHDLCKADNYCGTKDIWEYNKSTLFKGHGVKSVLMLSSLIKLTEEEVACIVYHMGAFSENKEDWRDYTRAVSKYPNVLWTHTADMLAAHVDKT